MALANPAFAGRTAPINVAELDGDLTGLDTRIVTLEAVVSSGTHTPVVTSGGGAFTTVSGATTYTKITFGTVNLVLFRTIINVTTLGTATSDVRFTLPHIPNNTIPINGFNQSAGGSWSGYAMFGGGASAIIIPNSGSAYVVNGSALIVSGFYNV